MAISALAMNFCTALSLSSLSSTLMPFDASDVGLTTVFGWIYLSWGEGVVVDDDGVAILGKIGVKKSSKFSVF